MSYKFDSLMIILNKLDRNKTVTVHSLMDDLEIKFRVIGLKDIKHWIYRWIPYVEVVSPKKLKDSVRRDLKEAIKKV